MQPFPGMMSSSSRLAQNSQPAGAGEKRHGEESEEAILKGRGQEGQARDEEAQGRHASQRPLGQEGEEPQAGDRHRPLRSAQEGRQGAEKEKEEILTGGLRTLSGGTG